LQIFYALAFIVFMIADNAADERAKANRPRPRSYEEVFTPEEAKKMGIITTCWTKMAAPKGSDKKRSLD